METLYYHKVVHKEDTPNPHLVLEQLENHHSRENKKVNQADRKEFDLIHNKIDNITKSIEDLKEDMSMAHGKTDESLRFLKENLFNPHEGLWAETKQNTQFRQNSQKWRSVIGIGFVGLVIDKVWKLFQ